VESCGPYKIVNETGSGDGWVTYLGRDDRGEALITVFTSSGEETARIIDLQQRASARSPHVAPVIDHGACDAREWYATRNYPRSVAKLLEGRAELNRAWVLQLLLAVTRGARAFKETCGRTHGNLEPYNIVLSGTTNIKEAEIVIKDPVPEGDADLEVRDLKAIGMTLYQLVRRREVDERSMILPLEVSAEWQARFGKDAERWVAVCNRLLDPALSLERYDLAQLERDLVALEPKAAVSRKQLVAAAAVLLCAGLASLVLMWMRNRAVLEVTSNLAGATVTVSSEGKVLKTVVIQGAPVTIKVRKGSYVVEGKRDDFAASTNVTVATRKQQAALHFEFGVLEVFGVEVDQNGVTNRLWSTNRYVTPGVEVKQAIVVDGYRPVTVKDVVGAGQTRSIAQRLEREVPGNVRIEISALPRTATIELRDAAGQVIGRETESIQEALPPGNYKVTVRYEVATIETNIVLAAGKPLTGADKITFAIPTGQLKLTALDGQAEVRAGIWHGTNQIGTTMESVARYWPAGTWTFRLAAPGYEETNLTVNVTANTPASKTQSLVAIVAIVGVTTDPPGARFGTNQNQLMWTNSGTLRLPPGKYTLHAAHDDLGAVTRTIEVARGQTNVLLEFPYGRVNLSANLPDVRVSHARNPLFRPLNALGTLPLGTNRLTGVYAARLTNVAEVLVGAAHKQNPLASRFDFQYGEVIFTNSLPGAEVFVRQDERWLPVGTVRDGVLLKDIAPWGKQTYSYRALLKEGMKTNSQTVTITSPGPYFIEADFKKPANHKTSFGMEFVWVEGMSNYVGKFEVGQAEYQAVMGVNPSVHRGATNLPVDSVTWTDAWQFCQRLQQQSPPPPGFRYTLPARSQWEAFATNALRDASLAVIKKGATGPLPRGSLKPNNFELHDVRGNLWEWTLEKTHVGSSFKSVVLGMPPWRPAGENPLIYKDDETGFRVILTPDPSSTQQAMK
jgi:hypothetical protein